MMTVSPRIGQAMAQAVTRTNERNNEPNPLFDQVVEVFEMRQQWPSGHTENVLDGYLRGKRASVDLHNRQGWIRASLTVLGKTQFVSDEFLVGYFNPESGWTTSRDCTLAAFNIWHRRTRARVSELETRGRL